MRWVRSQGRPALLLCSSRSASFAAWLLRIPGIGVLDYEHSTPRILALGCRSVWMPDILRDVKLPSRLARAAHFFAGLKENLYLDGWKLDRQAERHALGVDAARYLVVARPPADTAHYANDRSTTLWLGVIQRLLENDVRIVVSPRTAEQRRTLAAVLPRDPRITILERVSPGPGLVAAADLVLGGGGTMNREAAVLGIPVWSTFCGPAPRIDEQLASEGRLTWIRTGDDLERTVSQPLPSLRDGRGPFPDGFRAIFDAVTAQAGFIEPRAARV
jgi:predicted glycosyltransferase